MNNNIKSLYTIAKKKERRIIGLMSGTSLDGLDIAICRIKGAGQETRVIVEHFETVPYTDDLKNKLAEVCFREYINLQKLTLLNKLIADVHAKVINEFLLKRKIKVEDIDLVASHGQTIFHAPIRSHRDASCGNATLQIGDGDIIATLTGIITVNDFRQKNIAAGGEGAPLAAYGDLLLFAEKDREVIMLNIGGISNFTYLPANGKLISSDIGPGNTLMNAFVRSKFPGSDLDTDAGLALQGTINLKLLEAFKEHFFFAAPFPKTTGPELFNLAFIHAALERIGTKEITSEDILATLNKFSADCISIAINAITNGKPYTLYISGGGIHNPLLMENLKASLPNASFRSTEEKNIPSDAKEAVLFAVLANEAIAGDPVIFKEIPALPAVSMGKISFPY